MSQPKAIPERSQIPEEFTWNTADLYPTDQAWREDFSRLQGEIPKLSSYTGRLGESAELLYEYVTLEQETGERLIKLMDYAQRRSDEDTRAPEYQDMVGKITTQYVAFSQATAFEVPEVLRIPTRRPWSGSMPRSRSWSCTAGTFRIIQRPAGAHPVRLRGEAAGGRGGAGPGPGRHLLQARRRGPDLPRRGGRPGPEQHPLSNGSYTLLMASEDRALRRSRL